MITATLKLSGKELLVAFSNTGTAPAMLVGPRTFQSTPDGNYCEFDPPTVRYLGIQVKRGPYLPDEYVTLSPGETLTGRVNLSTLYDLSGAQGPLRARYRAWHVAPDMAATLPLTSDWLDVAVLAEG